MPSAFHDPLRQKNEARPFQGRGQSALERQVLKHSGTRARSSLLTSLAILFAAGISQAQTTTAPTTAPTSATTSAPAPRTVSIPASLEAFETADLYAKDSGFLSDVKADLGDHVKKGQVLALIDDPELQTQIDAAKAALAARQEIAKASQVSIEQTQKTVDVYRSQVAGLQADLELAQATLKRQEELFAAKAITNQQVDEARAKAKVAAAQIDVAKSRVAASETDVAAATANVAVAKAQVPVAEAEQARLQNLVQYTKVLAPFDGIITKRMVSRGDLVQSGAANRSTPLFTLQRIDTIRVFCDVPEASAAPIAPGTTASVKILGLDNLVINGTVTRIGTSLNAATRTMRTEIDLPNPDEKLRPGMYAQVTLTLPPK